MYANKSKPHGMPLDHKEDTFSSSERVAWENTKRKSHTLKWQILSLETMNVTLTLNSASLKVLLWSKQHAEIGTKKIQLNLRKQQQQSWNPAVHQLWSLRNELNHIWVKDKHWHLLLRLKHCRLSIYTQTLQVLMLSSDALPISDFFGCPFTRSFNCDPYPIHVFTLATPSEISRMRCCHLAPHVLPPRIMWPVLTKESSTF